jgi:hypothetical protein
MAGEEDNAAIHWYAKHTMRVCRTCNGMESRAVNTNFAHRSARYRDASAKDRALPHPFRLEDE